MLSSLEGGWLHGLPGLLVLPGIPGLPWMPGRATGSLGHLGCLPMALLIAAAWVAFGSLGYHGKDAMGCLGVGPGDGPGVALGGPGGCLGWPLAAAPERFSIKK